MILDDDQQGLRTVDAGRDVIEVTHTDVPFGTELEQCPACDAAPLIDLGQKHVCPRCRFVLPCCEGGPA